MIYTIGNCENYDINLEKDSLYKSKGGSVWKTISDVSEYFKNCKVFIENKEVNAGIYMVDGDWDIDVNKDNDKKGNLNKICKIVKKL